MKFLSSLLLFVLFTAVLGQSPDTSSAPTSPSERTTSPSERTTSPTETTTLEPSTTTVESTTTSEVVTTTTISTTTLSSTTSSSSTTEAPVPTSSPVPSTEAPEPKKCPFNVTEGNVTCIRAELQVEFMIFDEGKKYPVMLGCDASTSASACSLNETQTLVLSEDTHTLTMVFEKKAGKVVVNNITFHYVLPGGLQGTVSNSSGDLFDVKVGNSYMCKSKFDIYLENVTMAVHEIHIQAFIEEGEGYGVAEECDADEKVSDIVPIAVGVALAALIIIVLIAYLVGRRRSRQKGYQSV